MILITVIPYALLYVLTFDGFSCSQLSRIAFPSFVLLVYSGSSCDTSYPEVLYFHLNLVFVFSL